MKIEKIKEKAKSLGINAGTMKKTDLVRAIQKAEHNNPCYGTAQGKNCPYTSCCFMDDCSKVKVTV